MLRKAQATVGPIDQSRLSKISETKEFLEIKNANLEKNQSYFLKVIFVLKGLSAPFEYGFTRMSAGNFSVLFLTRQLIKDL